MAFTATEIMEAQTARRHGYIMDRLLHRLRKFMASYPRTVTDQMPDHDLIWIEKVSGESPGKLILDTIKSHPELWREALPPDVCIVSRKALEQCGLSEDLVSYLADMGDHFVARHAARYGREHEIH